MNEPTVTISLREFNALKAALQAAVIYRQTQLLDKTSKGYPTHHAEWEHESDRWRNMLIDYNYWEVAQ